MEIVTRTSGPEKARRATFKMSGESRWVILQGQRTPQTQTGQSELQEVKTTSNETRDARASFQKKKSYGNENILFAKKHFRWNRCGMHQATYSLV